MNPLIKNFVTLLGSAPTNFYSPLSRETELTQKEIDIRRTATPELRISHNEIIVRKFYELTIKGQYTQEDVNAIFSFLETNNIDKELAAILIDGMNFEITTLLKNNSRNVFNPY